MTDANKLTDPQHFRSDLAESELIRNRIPGHFWLRLDALAEVCALWAQSNNNNNRPIVEQAFFCVIFYSFIFISVYRQW